MKPKLGGKGCTIMPVQQYLCCFRSIWMWKICLGFPPCHPWLHPETSGGFAPKAAAFFLFFLTETCRGLTQGALGREVQLWWASSTLIRVQSKGGAPGTQWEFLCAITSVFCDTQGWIPPTPITCSCTSGTDPTRKGSESVLEMALLHFCHYWGIGSGKLLKGEKGSQSIHQLSSYSIFNVNLLPKIKILSPFFPVKLR